MSAGVYWFIPCLFLGCIGVLLVIEKYIKSCNRKIIYLALLLGAVLESNFLIPKDTWFIKLSEKSARRLTIDELRAKGTVIGDDWRIWGSIDYEHEYLVTLGSSIRLASDSSILTHDGSTSFLGYSKVGRVDIGDAVFVGASAIILPNVKIGSKVIIGAGSVITKDISDNSVVVGNLARIIGSYDEYVMKNKLLFEESPVWHTHYSRKSDTKKQEMRDTLLRSGFGFDINKHRRCFLWKK